MELRDLTLRFAVALSLAPVLAALCAPPAAARSERLRWTHTEPERVAGFRAYVGFAPGDFAIRVELPAMEPDETGIYSTLIENLPEVGVLYFAMIAYDQKGRESGLSNQKEALADRDTDGLPNESDNCPDVANRWQRDKDADGVGNACDNCTKTPNPRISGGDLSARHPGQVITGGQPDQDADGIGNTCDCDLDQSGACTSGDFARLLRNAHAGTAVEAGGDIDGSGSFTVADLLDFVHMLDDPERVPGPACPACPLLCEGPGCL